MSIRGALARLPRRLYVLGIFALGGVAASSLLSGHFEAVALAVVCIAAVLARPSLGVFTAGVAALLGAWLIAALTLLTVLTMLSRALVARLPQRRQSPDPEALAAAVATVPADFIYAARVRAGAAALTTWHLVEAARTADASRWKALLGDDPGPDAWDGPVLDLGQGMGLVTEFFAEAAGLGAEIARRRQLPIDADLLAVAATVIPLSAAEQWFADPDERTEQALGVPLHELIEAMAAFAGTDAGRDLTRRVQIVGWGRFLSLSDRRQVFELKLTALPMTVRRLLSS